MANPSRKLIQLALIISFFISAGCSHFNFFSAKNTSKITVEIRFAESSPTSNYHKLKMYGSDRALYVADDPILITSDIVNATTETGEDLLKTPIIIINLTEDAGKRLAQLTSIYENKPMAVIFNDKVMAKQIIDEPITSGRLIVTGRFTAKEAEDFVNRINRDIRTVTRSGKTE